MYTVGESAGQRRTDCRFQFYEYRSKADPASKLAVSEPDVGRSGITVDPANMIAMPGAINPQCGGRTVAGGAYFDGPLSINSLPGIMKQAPTRIRTIFRNSASARPIM